MLCALQTIAMNEVTEIKHNFANAVFMNVLLGILMNALSAELTEESAKNRYSSKRVEVLGWFSFVVTC